MSKPEFNPDDVRKVAAALIEAAVYFEGDHSNSWPGVMDCYVCECCDSTGGKRMEDLKHKLDCPVLIAQDLLT